MKYLITMFVVFIHLGCTSKNTYTLYRSSIFESEMRIHMATFDADDSEKYNLENCQTAADLFQKQPGVAVKYWCEKGNFKK